MYKSSINTQPIIIHSVTLAPNMSSSSSSRHTSHDQGVTNPNQFCRYHLTDGCKRNCGRLHGLKCPECKFNCLHPSSKAQREDHVAWCPKKTRTCPFNLTGVCKHGAHCRLEHGSACDLCGLKCLNPRNLALKTKHLKVCAEAARQVEGGAVDGPGSGDNKTLSCVFCREVPDPDSCCINSYCSHFFCRSCINEWISYKGSETQCPICKASLSNISLKDPSPEFKQALRSAKDVVDSHQETRASEPSSGELYASLFIRSINDRTINFQWKCGPQTTVAELKTMIEKREGVARGEQRLLFAGKQLGRDGSQDHMILADYGIQNENTIHLIPTRFFGGFAPF